MHSHYFKFVRCAPYVLCSHEYVCTFEPSSYLLIRESSRYLNHLICETLRITGFFWTLSNVWYPKSTFFYSPILFPICTSTCIQWHVEQCPVALLCNYNRFKAFLAFENKTYKLNLKNYNYKYNNYTINLVADHLPGVFAIACCLVAQ
jgi:hypothetical protein